MKRKIVAFLKVLSLPVIAVMCLLMLARVAAAFTSWMDEPWTADEKPYRQARREVDQARNNTSQLSKMVTAWEPTAKRRPFDHVVQYRWGYALYWLSRARAGDEFVPNYERIRDAMRLSTLHDNESHKRRSRSYEFNRLRFWVEQRSSINLISLGERLLQRDPNDAETQETMLRIRLSDCPLKQKASAIALWNKVAKRHSAEPLRIFWLGRIYNAVYHSDLPKGNPTDVRKANELFRRFLREAPETARYKRPRQIATLFIKLNERQLQKTAKSAAIR